MEILDINKNYRIRFEDSIYIDKNNETKAYTVISSSGEAKENCLVVLNYIKVLEGHVEAFEQECLEKDSGMERSEGFQSFHFLRPVNEQDHYVVITLWKDVHYFNAWIKSERYQQAVQEVIHSNVVNRYLTYRIKFYDEAFKRH